MSEQACCAHLWVKYDPLNNADGTMSDRWTCFDCRHEFWPAQVTQAELDQRIAQERLAFSRRNRTRCEHPKGFNHPLSSWSTSDWFLAILGELGEAANVAKKLNRVRDGIPGNKETAEELKDKLRKELGDSYVYLDLIAQSLGFYIQDAAVEVFESKSAEIGYEERIANLQAAVGKG